MRRPGFGRFAGDQAIALSIPAGGSKGSISSKEYRQWGSDQWISMQVAPPGELRSGSVRESHPRRKKLCAPPQAEHFLSRWKGCRNWSPSASRRHKTTSTRGVPVGLGSDRNAAARPPSGCGCAIRFSNLADTKSSVRSHNVLVAGSSPAGPSFFPRARNKNCPALARRA